MVEEKKTKIVTEDAVMGGTHECTKSEHSFIREYDDVQFPLTVSFYKDGEYRIKIEGKKAVVEKKY